MSVGLRILAIRPCGLALRSAGVAALLGLARVESPGRAAGPVLLPDALVQELARAQPAVVERTEPGLVAPRVVLAWRLPEGQEAAAELLLQLARGPLERRLVFDQEVALRVDAATRDGLMLIAIQLRPGVHPGVVPASVERGLEALLDLDDESLDEGLTGAQRARARRLQRAGLPAPPSTVVQATALRQLALALGLPSASMVRVQLPAEASR